MITKENVTIYLCEHCRKVYRRPHDCLNHEPGCHRNPENHHLCFDCPFLKKGTRTVYYDAWDGEHSTEITSFGCMAQGELVYSYKAENMRRAHNDVEDGMRMPTPFEGCQYNSGSIPPVPDAFELLKHNFQFIALEP